ncbi:MAG: GIN domain-containing protein, partial [Segetibacter sp.]
MKKPVLYAVLFIATLFASCINTGERVKGSGNIISEARPVGNAEKIKVLGDIDVFIAQGPNAVKVEGDDNVLQYIETVSDDNWFEIRTRDNINLSTSKPVKVYITTPKITDLNVSGSGNIKCNQKFSTDDNTSFNISGSGDIEVTINAPKVEARISGSGNLHISG